MQLGRPSLKKITEVLISNGVENPTSVAQTIYNAYGCLIKTRRQRQLIRLYENLY